ncbi:MAG: hypothetical protein L0H94_00855 [Nitrospira sp.]|nr:hypothetical protein [Nitrospira sp.]
MPHVEQGVSERNDFSNSQWSVSADETGHPSQFLNVLSGVVISRREGLIRTTLRIRVGERTDVRVRWQAPLPAHDAIEIGQTVRITIPAEAVQLESGGFRRGKQRRNRWIGRVVLVERTNHDRITTVKVHRDNITLNSVGPVIGTAFLTTWDTVNIVVDPQQVRVQPVSRSCRQKRSSRSSFPFVDSQPSSVWLRATILSVRAIPDGLLVALNVGNVNLSTFIKTNRTATLSWVVGTSVEINTNRCDVWIRHFAESSMLSGSVVFLSKIGIPPSPSPFNEPTNK